MSKTSKLLFNQRPPLAGLTAVILSLVLAGTATAQTATAQTATSPAAPLVTVATARATPVVNRVPVSATLVARDEILIYPQISGYSIQSILVDVGDTVRKGEVLAKLDSQTLSSQLVQAEAEYARAEASVRQAESQISSAQATLDQANASLRRTQQLNQSGNISQAQLDQSIANALTAKAGSDAAKDGLALTKAQLRQSGASLDLAKLNLSRATIRAGETGVISARNGQLGAIATSAGSPIFRIIREGTIEAEAQLIETALGQVNLGDPAEMKVAGMGNVQGTVRLIYPTVDPQTRLGTVRIALDASAQLRTGLFAGGWIVTDQHDGLTVPATAVLTDAQGTYVLKVVQDTLTKQPVIAGLIWQDRREVLSGLNKGDSIVAKAGAFFGNGDKIQPVAENATPAGASK